MMILQPLKEFLFEGDLQQKFFVKNYYVTISMLVFYVLFAKWLGPALMKNRKPFNLKNTMVVYNFMQCYFNSYIAYYMIKFLKNHWHERCMVKNNPDRYAVMQTIQSLSWLLFLVKYIDLLDTVFFVLRKKDSHVSFLHVFHHFSMCFFSLWYCRTIYSIGYYVGFALTINTCIHVIMYFYYGCSAIGPVMRKYLWWKRYLTQLQITQFLVVIIYMLWGFATGCEELGTLELSGFIYIVLLLALFCNFYKKYKQN